jgi:hypothetical protein
VWRSCFFAETKHRSGMTDFTISLSKAGVLSESDAPVLFS